MSIIVEHHACVLQVLAHFLLLAITRSAAGVVVSCKIPILVTRVRFPGGALVPEMLLNGDRRGFFLPFLPFYTAFKMSKVLQDIHTLNRNRQVAEFTQQ